MIWQALPETITDAAPMAMVGRDIELNVYCILVHENPEHLLDLLEKVGDKRFVIHIDRDTNRRDFLSALGKLPPGVSIIDRHKSFRMNWGGMNVVKAEFALFAHAAKFMNDGDYAILLSGQDYPARPIKEFEDFLHLQQGKEVLIYNQLAKLHELSRRPSRPGMWRVRYLQLRDLRFFGLLRKNSKTRAFVELIGKLALPNPFFNRNEEYFIGSQWIAVTPKFIEFLRKNSNRILKEFRFTFAPDEMAIHTFYEREYSKTLDDWLRLAPNTEDYGPRAAGPYHFLKNDSVSATLLDLNSITQSEKFFIRKPTDELRHELRKRL